MPSSIIAVVDVGKTHAKLLLTDARSGETLASMQRERRPVQSAGLRQLDLEDTWHWLLDALAAAPRRDRITDVVPVGHGAAAALLDARGALLAAPDYEDPAFEAVSAEYRALRDPFALTLSPELPLGLNLGRQLYYLQTREPRLFGAAAHLLLHPQYWAWKLCAGLASELTSLGCHTDLWQPRTATPSPHARARGWDRLLPPLQPADGVLGRLSEPVRARTGLPASCRVRCGIHDSNASWLAHLAGVAPDTPFSVISSGTWVIVMARGTDLARLDEQRDMLANVDAQGSPVATARFMGGREYAAIAGDRPARADAADLHAVVRSGALALPSFAEAGGPFAGRRGTLPGAAALTPAQRAALATLYVALMCDARLEDLGARGAVIVDGPLAGDALFLTTLAALRPGSAVRAAGARAGTLAGALHLAGCLPPRDGAGPVIAPSAAPDLAAYRARWRAALPAAG
ncbi:MAG: L-fuculose kinase [Gammaproteobacteria bacterium]|nr:L-fuculose kinase [Gammaproteobacteria bacterium]